MARKDVSVLVGKKLFGELFSEEVRHELGNSFNAGLRPPEKADAEAAADIISGSAGCVTSWGTCPLSGDILDRAPGLEIIVHAAGSVKSIATPEVWERGIKVVSCAPAIGIGVAEHALGLMLSALKRNYRFNDIIHKGGWRDETEVSRIKEICGISVGVAGAGFVGRHFIKLMGLFGDLKEVLVFDPYLAADEAERLGAEKVEDLNEMTGRVDVLSIHAPSVPETKHMLNASNLKLLKDGAVLINTARGSIIDEDALYGEAKTGRITACLDVTDPEPPSPDNPLRKLDNVVFTPHIAGAAANNKLRIGNMALAELKRYFSGKPLKHEVRKEDLARIA